jgi:hypothetical protein
MLSRPSPDDPDFFLKFVAPLVQNAFTSSQEYRAAHLKQCMATARALFRLCFELAPMYFPDVTPDRVTAFLDASFVKSQCRIAELAGLDVYQAESFVLTIQRAIEQSGEDYAMSQSKHEDPMVENARAIQEIQHSILGQIQTLQSIVREHEAKIRVLQEKIERSKP